MKQGGGRVGEEHNVIEIRSEARTLEQICKEEEAHKHWKKMGRFYADDFCISMNDLPLRKCVILAEGCLLVTHGFMM